MKSERIDVKSQYPKLVESGENIILAIEAGGEGLFHGTIVQCEDQSFVGKFIRNWATDSATDYEGKVTLEN